MGDQENPAKKKKAKRARLGRGLSALVEPAGGVRIDLQAPGESAQTSDSDGEQTTNTKMGQVALQASGSAGGGRFPGGARVILWGR